MIKIIGLASTLSAVAYAQDVHSVRGSDGQVKFSVSDEGVASAISRFSAPDLTASQSVTSPTITATESLLVGQTDVTQTFEVAAAERAAMQQALDKLEADAVTNAVAEQEQNARAEKNEADAQANSAADAELTERVTKLEADAAAGAVAEQEQNARVEKIEADAASNAASDAELQAKVSELERVFEQTLAEAKADYDSKIAELKQKTEESHDAQQRVLDHLVKIMSRFDVSGELDGLRQAASSASSSSSDVADQ